MSNDDGLLEVLEALEAAGLVLPLSQARALTEELRKRFPAMTTPVKDRKGWTRWTDDEYAEAKTLYESGASREAIAETLGKTLGQVNGAITRLGLRRG